MNMMVTPQQVVIRPPITIYGPSPSMGALLGTSASSEVLQEINNRQGATFFGSRYDAVNDSFMQNIIAPMRQSEMTLKNMSAAMLNPDQIISLVEPEHYTNIPASMHMPILLYAPVRDLLRRGRIDGFGYDEEQLPEEDIYERLLNNGHIQSLSDAYTSKDSDIVTFHWDINSHDPELSVNDRDAIRETREYVDYLLTNTDRDPTNIDSMRG